MTSHQSTYQKILTVALVHIHFLYKTYNFNKKDVFVYYYFTDNYLKKFTPTPLKRPKRIGNCLKKKKFTKKPSIYY